MKTEDSPSIKQLSRLCAVMIVLAHSLEILDRKIEAMAMQERMVLTRENKQSINGIIDGCRRVQRHMEHFSTWALSAAVTDTGEIGTATSYDVLQQDASDILQIVCRLFNASHEDDSARVRCLAWLTNMSKEPLIDEEIIKSLQVKI